MQDKMHLPCNEKCRRAEPRCLDVVRTAQITERSGLENDAGS
jgi:hypothetical protein